MIIFQQWERKEREGERRDPLTAEIVFPNVFYCLCLVSTDVSRVIADLVLKDVEFIDAGVDELMNLALLLLKFSELRLKLWVLVFLRADR